MRPASCLAPLHERQALTSHILQHLSKRGAARAHPLAASTAPSVNLVHPSLSPAKQVLKCSNDQPQIKPLTSKDIGSLGRI